MAQNFGRSLFLRIGGFLCFAGTNICNWDRLAFLAQNCDFQKVAFKWIDKIFVFYWVREFEIR